jgi:hypothetical protein
MERPITPEELQQEIREVFKAGKRRQVVGLIFMLLGLLFILVVGVGYLSVEYKLAATDSPATGPHASIAQAARAEARPRCESSHISG